MNEPLHSVLLRRSMLTLVCLVALEILSAKAT